MLIICPHGVLASGNSCEQVLSQLKDSPRTQFLLGRYSTYVADNPSATDQDIEDFLQSLLYERVDLDVSEAPQGSSSELIKLKNSMSEGVYNEMRVIIEKELDRILRIPITRLDIEDFEKINQRALSQRELEQFDSFYTTFSIPLPLQSVKRIFDDMNVSIPVFLITHTSLSEVSIPPRRVPEGDFDSFASDFTDPSNVDQIRQFFEMNADSMEIIRQGTAELKEAYDSGGLEAQDRVEQERDFEDAFDIMTWRNEQVSRALNALYLQFQMKPVTDSNLRANQYLEVMMSLQEEMRRRQQLFMGLIRFGYFF